MSELPEDLNAWPKNPYEILGVTREDDETTIKRAYTRLIRRFKPEHFPRQFQRLREAYDQVLQYRTWSEEWSPADLAFEQSPEPVSSVPLPADALLDAWRLAESGDESAAYKMLLAWERGDAESREPRWSGYARLFWLTRLFPAVDPQRPAVDWLHAGLKRTQGNPTLEELLRREMSRDPALLLDPRTDDLLSGLQGRLLADTLLMRWEAAARLDRSDLVEADLKRFVLQLSLDHFQRARLLIDAVDHWFFMSDGPRPTELDAYVEEAENLSLENSFLRFEMMRIDHLRDEDGAWRMSLLPDLPACWRRLRVSGRLDDLTFEHPDVAAIAASIAAEPREALQRLSPIAWRHPPYHGMLVGFLTEYCDARGIQVGELENLRRDPLVPPELRVLQNADYSVVRPGLLEFCLEHNVPPTRAAELFEAAQVGPPRLVKQTQEDVDLQIVFAVWRAVWQRPRGADEADGNPKR